MLLVGLDGQTIYSATKSKDFGQNLASPDLAKTALHDLFQKLKEGKNGEVLFHDFSTYFMDKSPSAFWGLLS